MDYIKEILNVGDDVLSAVTSAVEKNDYSNLSSELKARFRIFEEDVRDDIRTRTGQTTGGQNRGLGGGYGPGPGMGQGNYNAGPDAWNGNFSRDSGMGQGNYNAGPGSGTTGYGYGPEGSQASRQAAPGHTRETPKSGQYRSYARPSNSRNSRRSKNAWDSYTRRSKNTRNSFAWSPGNLQNLYNPGQQKELTPFRPRFFSKGVPIAKLVTGIIGMVGFLPLSIGSFIMMLMGQSAGLITFFSMLPLTAASIWLTVSGNRKRKLINLYNRYAEIIGPAEYIAIGDLADRDGNSGERVQENIHKLMKADMLPQGRLDRNETTLMLTSQAWEQYQAAERSRKEREAAVLQQEAKDDGLVNLNTASREELMTLNGIGEAKADAIISWREHEGPFAAIEDVMRVSGIKEAAFQKIRDKIKV